MFIRVQIGDDVDRDHPRLQRLAAEHLVEIERDALAVADGVHHHQRLARSELHDVAGGEEVRVAETPEPIDLDRAALVLELVGQPVERGLLSDGDDHVVDGEALGRRLSIDGDRRGVDRAGEARRDAAAALRPCRCRARRSWPARASARRLPRACRADLRARRHLLGVAFDGDHRHFLRRPAGALRARSRSPCCRRR